MLVLMLKMVSLEQQVPAPASNQIADFKKKVKVSRKFSKDELCCVLATII